MKMLNHPTCIKLYEVLASKTTIFMVLELVTGGELFDRIVERGRYDEKTGRNYFRQLIAGLEHCHSLGICHRDLKPENLLLDDQGGLKISDFGLSSLQENRNEKVLLHTACGTPNYVAPEVLMEKGYDGEAADIWSAGVILYVLLAGFLPFDEAHMYDLFRKIISADFQYPAWMSREAQDLIASMLEPDADRRATIADIKNSAFYRGVKLEETESMHRKNSTYYDYIATAELEAAAALAQARLDSTADQAASNLNKKWKGHRTIAIEEVVVTSKFSSNSEPVDERSTSAAQGDSALSGAAGKASGGSTPESTTGTGLSSPESTDISEIQHAPRPLNAFDLINMVSGQSMNNMLLFNKTSTESSDGSGGPVINVREPPTFTQFTSRKPIKELMQRLDYVLLETPRLKYKIFHRRCQVNLVWISAKNHIVGCHIEVFSLTPDLHMIQCKRVSGPILAHHEFFKKLRDDMKTCEDTIPLEEVKKKLQEWHVEHQNIKAAAHNEGQKTPEDAAFGSIPETGVVPGAPVALTYDTEEDFAANIPGGRFHPEESKAPTASPPAKGKYSQMPDTYISLTSARSAEAAEVAIAATEAAKAALSSNGSATTPGPQTSPLPLPAGIVFTTSAPAGGAAQPYAYPEQVPLTPAHLAIKDLRTAAAEAGACSPTAGPVRSLTFQDAPAPLPAVVSSSLQPAEGSLPAPTAGSMLAQRPVGDVAGTSFRNFSLRNGDRLDTDTETSSTSDDDDDRSIASEVSLATTNPHVHHQPVPFQQTTNISFESNSQQNSARPAAMQSFTPSARALPPILANTRALEDHAVGAGTRSAVEHIKERPSKSTVQ